MTDPSLRRSRGRPTKPAGAHRDIKLATHATPRFAQAVQRVADAEGLTVAALVRVSVAEFCKPRLAQLAAPDRGER